MQSVTSQCYKQWTKLHVSRKPRCTLAASSMLAANNTSEADTTLHFSSLRVLGDLTRFSNQALQMTCDVFLPGC